MFRGPRWLLEFRSSLPRGLLEVGGRGEADSRRRGAPALGIDEEWELGGALHAPTARRRISERGADRAGKGRRDVRGMYKVGAVTG
jgi:hypothetical protein